MSEKTEFGGWWLWVTLLSAISIVVLFGLNAAGLFGRTILERKIFEQSYQRQTGQAERLATFQAQLSEINARLAGQLPAQTRADLEAQKSAINIQIQTVRRTMQ